MAGARGENRGGAAEAAAVSGSAPPSAVLVAAFDSQVKWAGRIGTALAARGAVCRTLVPTDVRSAVSPAQAREYAAADTALERTTWAAAVEAAAAADVVVVALAGPLVERFTLQVRDRCAGALAPVVVTGWVGVIIENLVAGFLDRALSDVVAVSSRGDLASFTEVTRALGLPEDALLLSGLPLLTRRRERARPVSVPPQRILFADQPTVPSRQADRLYVYDRLIAYARAHPDRDVVLKPRHRPGEDTFHSMRHHPEVLLRGRVAPPGFRIDYTPVDAALQDVDLVVTISSTAALESVAAGVGTAVLTDLGVREDLGNHAFVRSGLLTTFDELEGDRLPSPDPAWLEENLVGGGPEDPTPAERVAERALQLVAQPDDRPSTRAAATPHARARRERLTAAGEVTGAPASAFRGVRTAMALRAAARRLAPSRAGQLEDLASRVWPRS